MTNIDVQAATAHARELREEARAHKRAETHHRRQARVAMRRLDEFRRELSARGIDLQIDLDTAPKEAQS